MSNWRVSITCTSWPRLSAASTRARVLYSDSWRERMTSRMLRPLLRGVRTQEVFLAHVHNEIASQGLAPQEHPATHARPAGDRHADAFCDRSQPDSPFH